MNRVIMTGLDSVGITTLAEVLPGRVAAWLPSHHQTQAHLVSVMANLLAFAVADSYAVWYKELWPEHNQSSL